MADRPTASTITDDQLEQLHEQLDRQDFVITEMARNYDRQAARAERAEQQRDQYAVLLHEFVRLADITHRYGAMGGHDCLAANLACAGCGLRDRARAALHGNRQRETAREGSAR